MLAGIKHRVHGNNFFPPPDAMGAHLGQGPGAF
jgi:hypothetical protein